MKTIAAYALGPHHGPNYKPWGVLSYSPDLDRHVLAEFGKRKDAVAARVRIAHDVDAFALLMRQSAGNWAVAK